MEEIMVTGRFPWVAVGALTTALLSRPSASAQAPKKLEPAPAMQSLTQALKGRGSTTYAYSSDGSRTPPPMSKGEEVWRTGPGGFTLLEEEHLHDPGQEIYLLAIHWWDESTKSLRGMLCNNS